MSPLILSQDRTAEFRSAVRSRQHSLRVSDPRAGAAEPARPATQSQRTVFMKRASAVAQEIAATTAMLQRLAQLARRRAMFDDRPQEIAELTVIIKQKVNSLKDNIGVLDGQLKELGGTKRDEQADTHSRNVVVTLQGKLKEITGDFAEVLEERSKNMQVTRSRTDKFVAPRQPTPVSNPLYQENPFAAVSAEPAGAAAATAAGAGGGAANPYAAAGSGVQLQEQLEIPSQEQSVALLEDQQTSYLSQRSSAVDAIESTINELGQMFSQLSTMISEQRETVQRIDANAEDISLNVGGAHRELLKYYARVSSNRGLMLKSFGVIILFFFLWVLIS